MKHTMMTDDGHDTTALLDFQDLLTSVERQLYYTDRDGTQVFGPKLDDSEEGSMPSHGWNELAIGNWNGPVTKLIDATSAEAAYTTRQTLGTALETSRLSAVMKTLRTNGEYRKLAPIAGDWRGALNALEAQFPNFAEVVDYLRSVYALAMLDDGVARPVPMLLNGPPGVGKTHFASHLAESFGSGIEIIRMENAQSSSALTGSAEYWGNTKPGAVFNRLATAGYANPVFFLDEIDKVQAVQSDPLSSLYSLMEKRTAMVFKDESYPWLPAMDASHIVWICTSNDASLLSAPIRSRLKIFDIPAPTPWQTKRMILSMFDEILCEIPRASIMELAPSTIDELAVMSPRLVQQAIREGMGRALYAGRHRVMPKDVFSDSALGRKMGFLP